MIGNPFQLADRIRAKTFIPNLANIDIWKFSFNCFELVHVSLPFYSGESDEGMMMTPPFLLILCRHLTRPDIQSLPPFPEGVHTRISYCPAVAYYMDKLCIRKDIVQKTDSRHARDLNK